MARPPPGFQRVSHHPATISPIWKEEKPRTRLTAASSPSFSPSLSPSFWRATKRTFVDGAWTGWRGEAASPAAWPFTSPEALRAAATALGADPPGWLEVIRKPRKTERQAPSASRKRALGAKSASSLDPGEERKDRAPPSQSAHGSGGARFWRGEFVAVAAARHVRATLRPESLAGAQRLKAPAVP